MTNSVLTQELLRPPKRPTVSQKAICEPPSQVYDISKLYFNIPEAVVPENLKVLIQYSRALDENFIKKHLPPVNSAKTSGVKSHMAWSDTYIGKAPAYFHDRVLLIFSQKDFLARYSVNGLPEVVQMVNKNTGEPYYKVVFSFGDTNGLDNDSFKYHDYNSALIELLSRRHYNCTVLDTSSNAPTSLKRVIFSTEVSKNSFVKAKLGALLVIE
jgi:hypothetical protein